jgi:polar amino acid transport system permease protein
VSAWDILWDQRDQLLAGFSNTLVLFAVGVVGSFVLGALVAYHMHTGRRATRQLLHAYVDGMRMLPFLIYAYLLYYGLPSLGLKLDAWTAGLIALVSYHAAYVGEILRGAWASLPRGQTEAGLAHGLFGYRLYRRLILPQLVMRTGPILGNQAIICLKDTAFLMIITVVELTAAASSVQSIYFIPFEAFIVAIALYWVVSLGIEGVVALVGRYARRRQLA